MVRERARLRPPRARRGGMCGAAALLVLVVAAVAGPVPTNTDSYAAAGPAPTTGYTTSHYERTGNATALYRQGVTAGKAGAEGIVILDFGRPAQDGSSFGTIGFAGAFVSLPSIAAGVESYISGYFRYAPSYTTLDVAIGTNNSCGTGQPCDGAICGCSDEPADFAVWGGQLAVAVEAVGTWAARSKVQYGYTDTVRVVAADDAEPAYDPGYDNTYNLLEGYAAAVGGPYPAMVDYGSAEAQYWTESQLLQVAYGFRPDVPMPQIYYPKDAADWGALLNYAKTRHNEVITIFGVLAGGGPGTNDPRAADADMLGAVANVTYQRSIPWLSTIAH